jgi:hypothetical protein
MFLRRRCHQKRGKQYRCKRDTATQKQSAMESTQILGKPECTDLLSNSTSFLPWSVHQTHEHTNVQSLYRSHHAQDRTTKTKPHSVPLVPELLVVLTSERVQLVCSTMCIPRVLQNPKIRSQPSYPLHTNSLERLQA